MLQRVVIYHDNLFTFGCGRAMLMLSVTLDAGEGGAG